MPLQRTVDTKGVTPSRLPSASDVAASLRRARYSRAPWAYLAANVPLVVVIYLLPHYHVYLWGLLGVGSAAAIVVGVVRNRPAHRVAWLCVAASG